MAGPTTAAGRAKAQANLAKGHAARKAKAEAARKAGQPRAADRWAALLSGQITVRDLDDEEIAHGKVRAKDGSFVGKSRMIPSHLALAFDKERVRRADGDLKKGVGKAVQRLLDTVEDPDVDASVRLRAATLVIERVLGKVPEVLQVSGDNPWAKIEHDAMDVDADLGDLVE